MSDCKLSIMDEAGFWVKVKELLVVMEPAYKLLRLADGDAPMMGKVYYHCYKVCPVHRHLHMSLTHASDMYLEHHVT